MKFNLCVLVLALLCECGYGGWTFWSDWTTCPTPCEGRSKSRRRYCVTQFCNGEYYQAESCEPKDCLVTTKISAALRQKENLATTVLANKVTKQPTVSNNTQTSELPTNTILLASSRGIKAILQETWHPFITVTVPAMLRNTKTLNTEKLPRVVNRSTSHISASRDIDPRDIFNRTQSRKEMYEPSSSKERTANESNNTIVILVALPVMTICVVFYTAVKVFQMFKSSRIKTLESVDVRTSNNELSLSDYRDQDLEEREYHYVSYDEISKRGSYEKKSPSQSYVYDVTWL